jgi:hypothetical protein
MNNRRLIILLAFCPLLLLASCKSVKVYTVRQTEMHKAGAPRLQVFAAGEQPAIVVELPKHSGWHQKAGTLWVVDALTGGNAWSESRFMREGSTNYFLPQGLSANSYVVSLMVDGDPVASSNFDVH